MSHKKNYRTDKTCLNCRHVVQEKFCPNCGQENIDTRKTFHHLFVHFFEDLTHYENAFWKTIRHLLFNPVSLTKEYLSGKRLSYLAPVRLYIFISFVTFFIISIFPNDNEIIDNINSKKDETINLTKSALNDKITSLKNDIKVENINLKVKDSLQNELKKLEDLNKNYVVFNFDNLNEKKLDSIEKINYSKSNFFDIETWLIKRGIEVQKKYTLKEIQEKGIESIIHNFPKVLLIYMPIFALLLWLIHNKKRWYYFDHGIFTLHYFSFLLLMFLIYFMITKVFNHIDEDYGYINNIIDFLILLWSFYYFFPAHHRLYGGSRLKSVFQSLVLLVINFFLISIVMAGYVIYSFVTIH